MYENRRIRSGVVALTVSALLGVGLLAGCGGSGSRPKAAVLQAQPVALSPSALLRAALAATRSGGAVHIDVAVSGKTASQDFSDQYSDDATATGGRQVITADGVAHATILLIGQAGYVQADLRGLEDIFGVPAAQAQQYWGQWIAVLPGETLGQSTYDDITAGITLASVAQNDILIGSPPALVKPTTIGGQRVLGVQGHAPAGGGLPAAAKNVLYVSDAGAPLPVLVETTGGGSYKDRMTFSHWHEKLVLTAPADPIPATEITSVSTTT